tara:strand:+ start:123 stop:1067 length:945 start_codon:yes stop_codon:yes gene_type:complete
MFPLILGVYGLSKNNEDSSGYKIIPDDIGLKIVRRAWSLGIRYIDTAPSYGNGNADKLIIKAREKGDRFKIISKIGLDVQSNKFIEDNIYLKNELKKLKLIHGDYINSVFLHSPNSKFLEEERNLKKFYDEVKSILGQNVLVGVSLRKPEDFELIMNFQEDLVIETNLSWFDLRILDYIKSKSCLRHSIIARSIYASGLLSLISNENKSLENTFNIDDVRYSWDIKKILNNNICDVQRVGEVKGVLEQATLSELALSLFPILSSLLDGIILGPLSIEELMDSDSVYQDMINKKPNPDLAKILFNSYPKINTLLY